MPLWPEQYLAELSADLILNVMRSSPVHDVLMRPPPSLVDESLVEASFVSTMSSSSSALLVEEHAIARPTTETATTERTRKAFIPLFKASLVPLWIPQISHYLHTFNVPMCAEKAVAISGGKGLNLTTLTKSDSAISDRVKRAGEERGRKIVRAKLHGMRTQISILLSLVSLGTVAGVAVVGCDSSSDETSSSAGNDASTTGDDDSTNSDGSVATGDGSTAGCPNAVQAQKLADLPDSTVAAVGIVGDSLVVFDPAGGADTGNIVFTKTGALLQVPKAGGAPTSFHTPTVDRNLSAFYGDGANIWFMEGKLGENHGVFRRSTTDSAATALGAESYDYLLSYFAGTDANGVYFVSSKGDGFAIVKLDRTSGAETILAQVDTTLFGNAQVNGGFVWFYGAQGTGPLYKTPVTATMASQVEVTTKNCFGGGLLVAGGDFYCGTALSLAKYDATFATPTQLFSILDYTENANGPRPNAVIGTNLLVNVHSNSNGSEAIYLVPTTPGPARKVVCGVGGVNQMTVDGNTAYWIESRSTGTETPKKSLWKAQIN